MYPIAFCAGLAMGTAFCSWLWIDTRRALAGGRPNRFTAALRVALIGAGLAATALMGPASLLLGMAGFWSARSLILAWSWRSAYER